MQLIEKYYPQGSAAHRALVRHSVRVAAHAVAIANRLAKSEPVDIAFVEEAALLHDIGILHTAAPQIGCHGPLPYLAHAYKGREILDAEGLPRHALVCERHVGIGLTAHEIVANRLPLPPRDMVPMTVEEQIVTFADLFYSKKPQEMDRPRSPDAVRKVLARYGPGKVGIFDRWAERFGLAEADSNG